MATTVVYWVYIGVIARELWLFVLGAGLTKLDPGVSGWWLTIAVRIQFSQSSWMAASSCPLAVTGRMLSIAGGIMW